MVVRFAPPPGHDDDADATHLDAHLLLRPGLPHPDLSDVVGEDEGGLQLLAADDEQDLRVPGLLPPARALELEERIWHHMQFANHLRSERLGEFTIATELLRSDSLAIVQLLVLYHLVTARAKVAVSGPEASTRS
jgi:phosphoribulokinase